MKRKLLSLVATIATLGAIGLVPTAGHAGSTGLVSDTRNDTIDPIASQNEATKTNQDIPLADIVAWTADFNPSTQTITLEMHTRGAIPRPGPVPAGQPDPWPAGFVGASYKLFFTSSTAQQRQNTGKSCGSYADNHPRGPGHDYTSHQHPQYAQCIDTKEGPYKAPNFKFFIDFGVRRNINSAGQIENEPDVSWGTFDTYQQGLTFRSQKADDPCTVGSGWSIGGGVKENTTISCPWGARIDASSVTGATSKLTLKMAYRPTWVVSDDLDDDGVRYGGFDDEPRSYPLAAAGGTISGIIATTWVDAVVGLPDPLCDPTDSKCSTDSAPESCINEDEADPTQAVDQACVNREVNNAQTDLNRYVANPRDCTPNGQRANCIQEIGGFVFQVDWAGKGDANPNNAYDMGLFSWPVPGYIASPSCRYQYAVPFVTSGAMPEGVGLEFDKQRRSGYTTVTTTYGVKIATSDDYKESGGPANGQRAGWKNIVVPGPLRGSVPATEVDNPLPTTYIANPVLNDSSCTYTPFVGAKFVEGEGVNGIPS